MSGTIRTGQVAVVRGDRIEADRSFGHPIGITGGRCDVTEFAPGITERGPVSGVADGIDQALRAARYQAKHGAKVIKTWETAGVLSCDATVGTQASPRSSMDRSSTMSPWH